ncbi:MAG: DNA-processing protein DprA [Planctomycetota bacterium]|nr:DNA-processing protein DprA [Planctomycetota bacterium]
MAGGFDLLSHMILHLASQVGPQSFKRLVRVFGSASAAAAAPLGRLLEVEGIREAAARDIVKIREDGRAEREIERCEKLGVRILIFESSEYPEQLRHIYDPPILLYVRGSLLKDDALSIAVVGSRRCTPYGRRQAHGLAADLARVGLTVVSGLARGIDTAAHEGVLSVEKGRTVAVLGNGLASVYPPENEALAERVAASGALISEFPLDAGPQAENFPRRNRIISGLSLGVVVVEGDEKSGALITAAHAVEQGREVFAVPGPVDSPGSRGPHKLIKQGAKLVERVGDILGEIEEISKPLLAMAAPGRPAEAASGGPATAAGEAAAARNGLFAIKLAGLNERERSVAERLSDAPVHIDEIIRETGLRPQEVAGTLMVLEIRGIARQLPGKRFVRIATE